MPTVRLMLCLSVLASSLAFAQEPAESPPSPDEPSLSPPPLVSAPEQTEPPPDEVLPNRSRPLLQEQATSKRIFLEALAGTGTGIAAGITGALSGVLLVGNGCTEASCTIPVLGAMSLGIVLGTPLGVYGVGHVMDGRGTYWAALGGTAIGSLAGLTLAVVFSSGGSQGLTVVSLVTGPVTGAILGYEFFSPNPAPSPLPPTSTTSSAPGFQWIPTFGVSPGGGILGGLAGRF